MTVDWFKPCLHGRTQTINVNGHVSDKQVITCSVPQGSILGPLVFILFVNDLHLYLYVSNCNLNLYADDTNLYSVGKTLYVKFFIPSYKNKCSVLKCPKRLLV